MMLTGGGSTRPQAESRWWRGEELVELMINSQNSLSCGCSCVR